MKSILIIRPSAIGDVVMASPMIHVLRKSFPGAYIAWLAEPPVLDLLRHNSELNEVIIWPKGKWRELFRGRRFLILKREISKFAEQLRSKKFDLVLDVQGLLRSRWLAWLSRAEQRIGFESKEPGRFLMTKVISRGVHSGTMGFEYSLMMKELGLDPGTFHPDIALSPEDEKTGAEIISAAGVAGRYAVFAPFTTRPQKHWFDDRWAKLAGLMKEHLNMPVVMLGGRGDAEHAEIIRQKSPNNLFNLAGKTTLSQTTAIIKNSSLLIGVDTGLTHMGAAFDCPTVALFGATCPYVRTAGGKTEVMYNPLQCSPCRRSPTCNGDFTCMKSITSTQVMDEALKLLEVQ
jgi:heptosyltransferase I